MHGDPSVVGSYFLDGQTDRQLFPAYPLKWSNLELLGGTKITAQAVADLCVKHGVIRLC